MHQPRKTYHEWVKLMTDTAGGVKQTYDEWRTDTMSRQTSNEGTVYTVYRVVLKGLGYDHEEWYCLLSPTDEVIAGGSWKPMKELADKLNQEATR